MQSWMAAQYHDMDIVWLEHYWDRIDLLLWLKKKWSAMKKKMKKIKEREENEKKKIK